MKHTYIGVLLLASVIIVFGVYIYQFFPYVETLSKLTLDPSVIGFWKVETEKVNAQGNISGIGIMGMGCLLFAFGLVMKFKWKN
jgi:hypothetical protein